MQTMYTAAFLSALRRFTSPRYTPRSSIATGVLSPANPPITLEGISGRCILKIRSIS